MEGLDGVYISCDGGVFVGLVVLKDGCCVCAWGPPGGGDVLYELGKGGEDCGGRGGGGGARERKRKKERIN